MAIIVTVLATVVALALIAAAFGWAAGRMQDKGINPFL